MRQSTAADLFRLSQEVERIARELTELPPVDELDPTEVTAPMVRELIRARRRRAEFFPPGIFADPAWDMLLDLYAAHLEGKRVSVTSITIASAVPPTTALRRLEALSKAGLIDRSADPGDGRRVFVTLSRFAAHRMQDYFASLRKSARHLGC